MEAIDSQVETLTEAHLSRRSDWYFHDIVPWERGESFREKPWDVSQCTISEEARTSLVLNLPTEDIRPYYHALIEKHMPNTSAFVKWNRLWTAEEGQHAIAIRSYLLASRKADPHQLEDDRKATMTNGYRPTYDDPTEIFAYTATQELATRVSHRNADKITDDPAAYELMRNIAADENHHFIFFKSVMQAMLDQAPGLMLEGIHRVFDNFQMPGNRHAELPEAIHRRGEGRRVQPSHTSRPGAYSPNQGLEHRKPHRSRSCSEMRVGISYA